MTNKPTTSETYWAWQIDILPAQDIPNAKIIAAADCYCSEFAPIGAKPFMKPARDKRVIEACDGC